MNSTHYDQAKLKELRERRGLTQDQLAKVLEVDRQTIYRAEAGRAASYDLLCLLAHHHDVDVTSLLHARPVLAQAA